MIRFTMSVVLTAIAVCLVSSVPHTACGADTAINWHSDVASAMQEASAENRPIMMFVTAKWCKYCHKMENVTFTNGAIAQKLQDRFVSLVIDADEQPELVERFNIDGFPATLFFSPDGKLRGRAKGYLSPAKANRWLEKISSGAK